MSPPEDEPPDGEEPGLVAHASDQATIYQASRDQYVTERDLHLHYEDGVRRARHTESGPTTGECPYPGLAAFATHQAQWFFGRDIATADLLVRLDARLTEGGPLAVVAPSGAGKSSLLRAGLLPALARGALPARGSANWPRLLLTPTGHPLAALATQLQAATGVDAARATHAVASGPSECAQLLDASRPAGAEPRRLVVIVDQLEELFTLCADEQERSRFLDVLSGLSRSDPSGDSPAALVVLGLRSDFYSPCADYPQLRAALQDGQTLLGPMSRAELRQAIVFPAKAAGLEVEPGLVELLLSELGVPRSGNSGSSRGKEKTASYGAGKLPLLAHALRATWQQRHGRVLTVDGYRSTGGIQRAVATTAERLFTSLDNDAQDTARALFMRLVKIGEGVEDTRRRIPHAELRKMGTVPEAVDAIIDAFTRGRLMTLNQDTVEITHEALLHAWPRLHEWIEADRAGQLIHQDLEDAAADWDHNRGDVGRLYRGHRLEDAQAWARHHHREGLTHTAAAFLAASTRQERRTVRRRRVVTAVLAALALVASSTAVVAVQQRSTAQAQRDTAVFNQIRAEAERLRGSQASLAAQLDVVAYRMRPDDATVQSRLMEDVGNPLSTPVTGHTDAVEAVAYSPDGKILASGADDGTVRLWGTTGSIKPSPVSPVSPVSRATLHVGDGVASVAFSMDGRILATGTGSGLVFLWNVTEPAHPRQLGKPLTAAELGRIAVAFSSDRHTLATAGSEGTVRLWDLGDRDHSILVNDAVGDNGVTPSLSFTPDGKILAGAVSGQVRLWNVADRQHPRTLGEPLTARAGIRSVAFAPHGRTLATAESDGTLRLWNIPDAAHPASIGSPLTSRGTLMASQGLAYSPDGLILAAVVDRGVQLWNMADPARPWPLNRLLGHTNFVTAVVFRPDGGALATASFDRTVLLWAQPQILVTGATGIGGTLAFRPDGNLLAGASADVIRLWNPTHSSGRGMLGQRLASPAGFATSLAFSSDSRLLALGTDDGERLWDVSSSAHPTQLGHLPIRADHYVNALAFSPASRLLATVGAVRSDDGNADESEYAQLWALKDPAHPQPIGHPFSRTDTLYSVAFSPTGHVLAVGSDVTGHESVQLWNVTDPAHPQPQERFPGIPGTGVEALKFSPNGRILALVAGGSGWLWHVGSRTRPTQLRVPGGDSNEMSSLTFSSDGQTLMTGAIDGVRLWNVADPDRPVPVGQPLGSQLAPVTSIALGQNGHTVAAMGLDGAVRLWEVDIDRAVARICNLTASTLTRDQWHAHITGLSFKPPCREGA